MIFFLYLVSVAITGGAVTFHAVPPDCRALLIRVESTGLVDVVDWRPLVRHLARTHLAIDETHVSAFKGAWRRERALEITRWALRKNTWRFEDGLDPRQSFLVGFHEHFDPRALPMWASLRGFDAVEAIRGYITRHARGLWPEQQDLIASLAPYWLKDPRGPELADLFGRHSVPAGWTSALTIVHNALPIEHRARFRARVLRNVLSTRGRPGLHEDQNLILRTLACRSRGAGPCRIGDARRADWIDLKRHPPVAMDEVRAIQLDVRGVGNCPDMSIGHLRAVAKPHRAKPTLIYVEDRLVGLVKGELDPSFLALRNVTDRRGRLVLAMGGVYSLSNAVALGRARARAADGMKELRLRALGVRPKSFLFNWNAWANGQPSLIAKVAGPHLSAPGLKEVRRAIKRLGIYDIRIDRAAERLAWFALLDALADFRERHELVQE